MLSVADSSTARVLVVDDEPDLLNLVAHGARSDGFVVDAVTNGHDAIALARRTQPAVVVLDFMLPDMLGTAVCAALRHDPAVFDVSVLMLTARGGEADRIEGLEAGADDYVVKPFSLRELVLRIRALARRTRDARLLRRETGRVQVLRWRGLEVDTVGRRVSCEGEPLAVRPLELALLVALLARPGVARSRAELLAEVWGIEGDTDTRTVDTHVRRLRERLGPFGEAIETVQRFGYRWAAEEGG